MAILELLLAAVIGPAIQVGMSRVQWTQGQKRRAGLLIDYILVGAATFSVIEALQSRGVTHGTEILLALLLIDVGCLAHLLGYTANHWRHWDAPVRLRTLSRRLAAVATLAMVIAMLGSYHAGTLGTGRKDPLFVIGRVVKIIRVFGPPFIVQPLAVGLCVLDEAAGEPSVEDARTVECSEPHRWQVVDRVPVGSPCIALSKIDAPVILKMDRVDAGEDSWCLIEAVDRSRRLSDGYCPTVVLACTL